VANPSPQVLAERILAKTVKVPCKVPGVSGDCYTYTGALNKGYGQASYYMGGGKQKTVVTHRAVWEVEHGPIPYDMTIDHLCFNRACQNVGHMNLKTRGDNTRAGAHRNPVVIANRAKTHCPQGHPYDEENTYSPPSGGRYCRTCGRRATKAWRERSLELKESA